MTLIPQLNAGSNWELLYSENFTRAITVTGAKIPIPVVTVPILSDAHLLAIYPFSASTPDRYYVGGYASFWAEINIGTITQSKGRIDDSVRLQLDEINLVRVPKISANFELRLATPRYFDDIEWGVYEYIGLGEPTIEGKLDAIHDQIIQ